MFAHSGKHGETLVGNNVFATMFPSETFDVSLCFSLMFPIVFAHSGKHGETLVGNNVSATVFPSLPWALVYSKLQVTRSLNFTFEDNEK